MVFLFLGGYIAVGHGFIFVHSILKTKKQYGSGIPLVGGISGSLGVLLLPVYGAWKFAWVPLILDFGCLPTLIWFWIEMRRQAAEKKREDQQ
jgi:hypothetical protein